MLKSPWHESENYGINKLWRVEGFMAWLGNHDIHDLLDSWLVHDWFMTHCSGSMAC